MASISCCNGSVKTVSVFWIYRGTYTVQPACYTVQPACYTVQPACSSVTRINI